MSRNCPRLSGGFQRADWVAVDLWFGRQVLPPLPNRVELKPSVLKGQDPAGTEVFGFRDKCRVSHFRTGDALAAPADHMEAEAQAATGIRDHEVFWRNSFFDFLLDPPVTLQVFSRFRVNIPQQGHRQDRQGGNQPAPHLGTTLGKGRQPRGRRNRQRWNQSNKVVGM